MEIIFSGWAFQLKCFLYCLNAHPHFKTKHAQQRLSTFSLISDKLTHDKSLIRHPPTFMAIRNRSGQFKFNLNWAFWPNWLTYLTSGTKEISLQLCYNNGFGINLFTFSFSLPRGIKYLSNSCFVSYYFSHPQSEENSAPCPVWIIVRACVISCIEFWRNTSQMIMFTRYFPTKIFSDSNGNHQEERKW